MINHPLQVGTKVRTNVPACPCTGRKFDILVGTVRSIEVRNNEHWYNINGRTIKDKWIIEVLK